MENNNININVESNFIKERSSSAVPIYLFSYNIEIYNGGAEEVRLLSRYWHIKDGNGHVEEIRGPGVVGLKPLIGSDEIFKYSSYCPLKTPFGVMSGSFQLKNRRQGIRFDVLIPPFSLTVSDYIN
jgi:ApaG protein